MRQVFRVTGQEYSVVTEDRPDPTGPTYYYGYRGEQTPSSEYVIEGGGQSGGTHGYTRRGSLT